MVAIAAVRDQKVAGSNPVTSTSWKVLKSMDFKAFLSECMNKRCFLPLYTRKVVSVHKIESLKGLKQGLNHYDTRV